MYTFNIMAANVNLGQSVWNADDIINPVTTVFCVVIYVDCIYYTVIFSTKYNMHM